MRTSIVSACLSLMFVLAASAELPPSAYEAMQAKASEYLEIEVLRVDVEPGSAANEQKVNVLALAQAVTRTASGLRAGDIVHIVYTLTERPPGWAGPGQIPLLTEKERTVAYLTKNEPSGDFSPAAGAMSFRNF